MSSFKGRDPELLNLLVKRGGDIVKTSDWLYVCPTFLRR